MKNTGNLYLRTLACTVFVLGVIETVIGATARGVVKNYGFGCWWTGVMCMLAGFFGVVQGNKNLMGVGYCLRYLYN